MYINLNPNISQSTRTLATSKSEAEQELARTERALSNILEQPEDSHRWASRVAAARTNRDFWKNIVEQAEKQLQDHENTVQLVLS